MNHSIKLKWVEALKSGEYDQVCNGLRKKSGYDPLGVLCDLHYINTLYPQQIYVKFNSAGWNSMIDFKYSYDNMEDNTCSDFVNKEFISFYDYLIYIGVESSCLYKNDSFAYDGYICTLPPHVAEWAELNTHNPWLGEHSITHYNDVFKLSFTEIAKLINKHL